MGKENVIPSRPEVIDSDVWYYDDQRMRRSTSYLNIDGGSPDITNHLSHVTFDIVSGAGSIATQDMIAHVEAGNRVTITPGTKYSYVGKMAMLVTAEPAMLPQFVTFGSAKLDRSSQKILRKIEREIRTEQYMQNFWKVVDATTRMAGVEAKYWDATFPKLGD